MLHLVHGFVMVLKLGDITTYVRNTLKVLICDGREGWRSVEPITWKTKKYSMSQGGEEYPTYH